MSEEIAEVLANGRTYIENNGWWRGHLLGPNGRQACAVGGLLFGNGYGQRDLQMGPITAAVQALEKLLQGPENLFWDLMDWNDSRDGAKDKQAVLDLFARAEKIERAGFDPDEGIVA